MGILLECRFGHFQGADHDPVQAFEAALLTARRRQVVEPLLGGLDLPRGRVVDVVGIGLVDHVLADLDELAAQVAVVDGTAVVLGVDHGHHRAGQPHQVLGAAGFLQCRIVLEQGLEHQHVGQLAAFDQLAAGLVDASQKRVGEMLRAHELRDLLEGPVVGEDGAQERLFGLVVVRRHTVLAGVFLAAQRARRVVVRQRGFHGGRP